MALVIGLRDVVVDSSGVAFRFRSAGVKTDLNWPSIADMHAEMQAFRDSAPDTFRRLMVAIASARQPTLSNPAAFANRSMTFDHTITNILRLT